MDSGEELRSDPSIDELIELANSILESSSSIDDTVQIIERYSSHFERWCDDHPDIFQEGFSEIDDSLDSEDLANLRILLSKHERVLEKALSLKDAAARQIRDHRVKGKGIMAYLDRLPKVVSTRKSKKG